MSQYSVLGSLLPQAGEGLGMRACGHTPKFASARHPSPQPLSRLRARGSCESGLVLQRNES